MNIGLFKCQGWEKSLIIHCRTIKVLLPCQIIIQQCHYKVSRDRNFFSANWSQVHMFIWNTNITWSCATLPCTTCLEHWSHGAEKRRAWFTLKQPCAWNWKCSTRFRTPLPRCTEKQWLEEHYRPHKQGRERIHLHQLMKNDGQHLLSVNGLLRETQTAGWKWERKIVKIMIG